MLDNITKSYTMNGGSVIDGKSAAGFSMSISSDNPVSMSISAWVNDTDLYKNNITQCRADEEEFRKKCQALQDKLIEEADV